MPWVLPGGARLSEDGARIAIRPDAGVLERRVPTKTPAAMPTDSNPPATSALATSAANSGNIVATPPIDPITPKPTERLVTLKLILEVLTLLVGLIGAVLALFGLSQK